MRLHWVARKLLAQPRRLPTHPVLNVLGQEDIRDWVDGVAVWHILTKGEADRHTGVKRIAYKLYTLSHQLRAEHFEALRSPVCIPTQFAQCRAHCIGIRYWAALGG